ncbi:uncharacterized protein LOC105387734 [Plutella xylostella]|uniref:uncharacterized protein LOC105387734 n=1 Tax=Plutella xylostella TaxID=51655 RepID=UPI002032D353|nr:uncharacterized protein LOC105387734 [Plutella xylostella]
MAEKQNVNNVISKRIIAFVKKNPILYEPSGGYGKNLRLKDQTWMELVPQLGLSLNTIKYKWRNIRDSYSRHLKATASGERDKQSLRYRNWLWSSHMEFMRPYVNLAPGAALTLPRPRVANTTEDVEDDNEETETKPETITDNQDEEESEEDTRTIPQIIKGETRIEKRRFQRITLPKPPPQRPLQRQSLDGIDHIFLGYAKTVKKLSPRRQVLVKMEIAKVMMQAEMEELQGEQTTNPLDLEETADSNMMTPLLNGVVCKQQVESEDESYNEML